MIITLTYSTQEFMITVYILYRCFMELMYWYLQKKDWKISISKKITAFLWHTVIFQMYLKIIFKWWRLFICIYELSDFLWFDYPMQLFCRFLNSYVDFENKAVYFDTDEFKDNLDVMMQMLTISQKTIQMNCLTDCI